MVYADTSLGCHAFKTLSNLVSAEPSVDCPPITYSIYGNSFEFGRKEFFLVTGFLFGKLPKKETYKVIPSSLFLDRIFPDRCTNRVKKVNGDELMLLFTADDLWFGISDHDAVRTDSIEFLVPDVEQEQNLICPIADTADETSQLDLNIYYDDHVQDLNSAYQDMNKDSNIHCEDHGEEQNSSFQDMNKESNIHSHDTAEQQNSPNMCKEHVLAEFDAIKATVDIIDKIKEESKFVTNNMTFFVLSAVSDVFHQEVAFEKKDWPDEASGFIYAESQDKVRCFNDMLDHGCKDHQLNDNVPIGLVKPVDMMCGEVIKSDDKLDETLDVGVIVDCATLQSSSPPNAMDYQDPQPTDKVTAEVFVVVQVYHVGLKPLIIQTLIVIQIGRTQKFQL
uniref:Uncharacterized protein n=1 Tax=Tanacetum cinerariifolium TaxID=118510 RepID=A0A6L2NC16_TANCI|nr:hypothetical protein [Tanacetum cinerariifolium]